MSRLAANVRAVSYRDPKNERLRLWLKASRKDAGFSNVRDKLLPALAEEGIKLDYATYAGYESANDQTRRIENKPELLARLAAFWEVPVPSLEAEPQPKSELQQLIESNRDLTSSISQLVSALALREGPLSPRERVAALMVQSQALAEEAAVLQRALDAEAQTPPRRRRSSQG